MRSGRRRLPAWLGGLLLINYAVVLALKWRLGALPELFWISHASLPLTGLALLLDSVLLVDATLVLIFVPHLLWLTDFVTWRFTGVSPMGITAYLGHAHWMMCLSTAHHLYILPLLLTLFARRLSLDRAALPLASALFVGLALIGRCFLPAGDNVNYAFAVLPGMNHPLIHWINSVPGYIYFPGMIVFMIVVFLTPTAWLLSRMARLEWGRTPSPHAAPHQV